MHYPSFRHHCRFKILLHCRILNRQWHVGSDAHWLLLPVLHSAVIRFRKTKKAIQQACWLEHARYRRCRHHARWLPPPLHSISSKKKIHTSQIKDGFNTSEKLIHKSIRASQTKEKGSAHHKSIHPQIDSYITDKGLGFNTNKITHLQIDSHNTEREGRSGTAPP